MRVVFDTHVLMTALVVGQSPQAKLISFWRQKRFDLVTCEVQLKELRELMRQEAISNLIRPALAGELVNQLKGMAICLEDIPYVPATASSVDNYLLGIAEGSKADVLVLDNNAALLGVMRSHGLYCICGVTEFLALLEISYWTP